MRKSLKVIAASVIIGLSIGGRADASVSYATSDVYAGVVVNQQAHSDEVSAAWKVPHTSCQPGENSYNADWVGISGPSSSGTIQQIGVQASCKDGSPFDYPWYEFFPNPIRVIQHTVSGGDSMTATVTRLSNDHWSLKLVDSTRDWTYNNNTVKTSANFDAAEVVAERINGQTLADFGSLKFSSIQINGEDIGSSPISVNMTASTNGPVIAAVSALSDTSLVVSNK